MVLLKGAAVQATLWLFYLPPPPPPGIPGTIGVQLAYKPRRSSYFVPFQCYASARRAHFGQMAKWAVWTKKAP